MKFCPVCQTRYDEEILRFCTKDGASLIEEKSPTFIELPSESANDDLGEETVIRRNPKPRQTIPAALPEDFDELLAKNEAERIVIPTEEIRREQQVRTSTTTYQMPPQSNTAKVVFLTILGTIVVLAGAGGIFWFLRSQTPANNSNANINTNPYNISTNLNTNLNLDNSFNFNGALNANANANANVNLNISANANVNVNAEKSPSPTPKPSISPTPKPSETPVNINANVSTNANSPVPPNVRPSITPLPPRPTISPVMPPSNRPVNAGVLNGQAVNLPAPAYPSTARTAHANGKVVVQILLDENGSVMSAKALSGNPLLRQSAEAAAMQSRFNPIRISGQAVSATGLLIYNFVN